MHIHDNPDILIVSNPGEIFAISLESSPTTGYTWNPEFDPNLISLLSPPQFVPDSSAIGGSGKETFKFSAKGQGETKIIMKYQREWETTALETKIFKVSIKE